MSILSSQPLAAVAELIRVNWVLVVLSAICLGVAISTRAVTLRRLPGPPRIPSDQSAWPIAGILFGAMGFWLLAVTAVGALWTAVAPKYGASTQPMASDAGSVLLNTIPPVVGLVALLYGDRFIFPVVRQDLGLSISKLWRGLLYGAGGALLVIPPLYLTSQLMELLYRSIHYAHETEHPLLHVLGQGPSPWITATIIVGACLIAPVAEEVVFRGHVQTLIVRAIQAVAVVIHRLFAPGVPEVVVGSEISDAEAAGAGVSVPPPGNSFKDKLERSKYPAILSIVITSLLFASVHPLWSVPIIFLLALALGYAYERTGNLWVPITMHAMFNTISTLLFLLGAGS